MAKKFQPSGDKLIAFILFVFSFLLYTNSIFNDYNLDDELVTRNHRLTSKGISAIPEIFTSPYYKDDAGNEYEYRPVVLTTFAIEHTFFGDNPHVSHFFNVLLYSLSIVVLFFTLRLLLSNFNYILPLAISLLFLAHPIHTEVVASIKNRDEVLSLLGGIGALYFVLRFTDSGKWWWYPLFVLSFIFGVLSKQSVISFTVIIPLAVVIFRQVSPFKIFLITLPLSIVMALMLPIYLWWHRILLTTGVVLSPLALNSILTGQINVMSSLKKGMDILLTGMILGVKKIFQEGMVLTVKKIIGVIRRLILSIGKLLKRLFGSLIRLPGSLIILMVSDWEKMKSNFTKSLDSEEHNLKEINENQKKRSLIMKLLIATGIILLFLLFVTGILLSNNVLIIGVVWVFAVLFLISDTAIKRLLIFILPLLTLFVVISFPTLNLEFELKIFLNPAIALCMFLMYFGEKSIRKPAMLSLIVLFISLILLKILLSIFGFDILYFNTILGESLTTVILFGVSFHLFTRSHLKKYARLIPLIILLVLLFASTGIESKINSLAAFLLIVQTLLLVENNKFRHLIIIPFLLYLCISCSVFVSMNFRPHSFVNEANYAVLMKSSEVLSRMKIDSNLFGNQLELERKKLAYKLKYKAIDVQGYFEEKSDKYSVERDVIHQEVVVKNVNAIAASPAPKILPKVGRDLSYVETPFLFAKNFSSKTATAFYVLGKYLQMMMVPYPLSFYYGYKHIPIVDFTNWFAVISITLHLILSGLSIFFIKKHPPLSFGIIAYLLSIAPFSNIAAPIAGLMGERLAYVASFGFCITIAYLICLLFKEELAAPIIFSAINKKLKVLMSVILLLYSVQTFSRNLDWKNHLTLFKNDISHLQLSSRAHHLLATHLVLSAQGPERRKMINEAINHFSKSLEIYPEFPYAWYDLGRAYLLLDEKAKAMKCFENSIKVDTIYAMPLFDFGILLDETGNYKIAAEHYSKAIGLDSSLFSAFINLSFDYFRLKDYQKSIEVNLTAARKFPNTYEPYVNIGKTYYSIGDMDKTIEYMEKAFSINSRDKQLVLFLVDIYQKTGNSQKAQFYSAYAQKLGN